MKKLLKWQRILRKEIKSEDDWDLEFLRSYGFVKLGRQAGNAWVHKRERVVAKLQFIVSERPPKHFTVPSLFLHKKHGGVWGTFTVQPLCVYPRKHIRQRIAKQLYETVPKRFCLDLCDRNVGLYRRRPVMFDW